MSIDAQPATGIQAVAVGPAEAPLALQVVAGTGAGAAVVVVPSVFGVRDDVLALLRRLAPRAARAVVFDTFNRVDEGVLGYDEMPRLMARIRGHAPAQADADLAAAVAWARDAGGTAPAMPVVVLGICFGGGMALRAAVAGRIDGLVTWHGTRLEGNLAGVEHLTCPVRLHFGEDDPVVPAAARAAIAAAFAGHPDAELVVHPGATHGYSHPDAEAWHPVAAQAGLDALFDLVGRLGA